MSISDNNACVTKVELEPGYVPRLVQNLLAIGILYALFYATRYNIAASMKQIMPWFGWSTGQMGFFETALPIIYGLSVFLNGPITDRIGGKKAFLWGAAGVVLANFIMGALSLLVVQKADTVTTGEGLHAVMQVVTPAVFHYPWITSGMLLTSMIIIWAFNGYCQSFGAIAIVKINFAWVPKDRRGVFSGVFGIIIRLGIIFAFSGVHIIAKELPIQYIWWLPAICVAIMAIIVGFTAKNAPEEVGFKPLPHMGEKTAPSPLGEIFQEFVDKIRTSKAMWKFLLASAMVGFVRRGTVDSWFSKYIQDVFPGNEMALQTASVGIAVLGIIGGFYLGSRTETKNKNGNIIIMRSPVIFAGFIGMTFMLIFSGMVDVLNMGSFLAVLALCLLSFFVNGSHGVICGAAAMDMGGSKHTGTMVGMLDGAQYVLASWFTGWLMGEMLGAWGWSIWQWVLIPFPIFGAWLMYKRWKEEEQELVAANIQ